MAGITLGALFIALPGAQAARRAGHIQNVEGSAQIMRQGEILPAVKGLDVFEADEVTTDPESLVELLLLDGSSLHLGPESHFALDKYQFSLNEDSPAFTARMIKGVFVFISGIISKLHPEKTSFDTPDGTIAIRGTKILVRVIEPGEKAIAEDTPGWDPGSFPGGRTLVILFRDANGLVGQVVLSTPMGHAVLDKENHFILLNKDQAPSAVKPMARPVMEGLISLELHPVIFEDYLPPRPFTETLEILLEPDPIPDGRSKQDPYSFTLPGQ